MWTDGVTMIITGAILLLLGLFVDLEQIDVALITTVSLMLLVGGAVSLVVSKSK